MKIFKSISKHIEELSSKNKKDILLEEAPKELDKLELHMKAADMMLNKALKAAAIATTITVM